MSSSAFREHLAESSRELRQTPYGNAKHQVYLGSGFLKQYPSSSCCNLCLGLIRLMGDLGEWIFGSVVLAGKRAYRT